MPLITDIRPQKRKARFNIYLDGKFSFGLDAETLVKSGLRVSQEISQEQVQQLVKENEFTKIYDRVLMFLAVRPRSEKEIKDWFVRKEVGGETQKLVWQKLSDLGYINDEEFAKWWIEQRTTFRPMGKRAIEMELKNKGIDQSLITQLLNDSITPSSELTLAKKAVKKKIKYFEKMPQPEVRQKLSSFLARRGFSWETIKKTIDEISKKE